MASKSGGNRRKERDKARKLAKKQGRQLTRKEQEILERAFLDPHVSGITSTEPKLSVVKDLDEIEELSRNQSWVRRAWEDGTTIIKISISTKHTRKKFAIRG